MPKIKIEFDTDNDAFKQNGLCTEIHKILEDIQTRIALGYEEAYIVDSNGNQVGSWSIKEEDGKQQIMEAYVLLEDSSGTMSSTEIPFGLGVTTEEEAKRFATEGGVGYTHRYEKIAIFENKDDGISWIFREDGRDPWAKKMDKE